MAGYTFGKTVWGWTSNGNQTCAQAGIKYEQTVNTDNQVRFRVSGCMRSGDGTRNHYNRYFYVTVKVQYRLDGTGNWIDLGSKEGSTDYNLNNTPPGLESPATTWFYTPYISRQNVTNTRLIEFRTYVPASAFETDATAVLSTRINPTTYYNVYYDPGESTGAPSPQIKYYNTDLTLSTGEPETLTGYHFKNWNTKLDGSGTTYEKGATYTKNEEVILHAQYEPNEYTVSYDYNYKNKPAPLIQTVVYNQEWTTTAGLQRDKYWFLNWNTNSAGTGTSYSAATNMGKYTITNNSVYYAQWTPAEYSIKYFSNASATDTSVNGIPKAQTKISGQSITLSSNIPTRNGYDFIYWASTKNGETPTYTPNTVYNIDKALNLYATWSAVYCAVTYNGNVPNDNDYPITPASSMPSAANVQRDLKWTIENKTPKRLYHTFEGWYTNSAATGTAYYPNSVGPIVTANTTLYANWSRDQYSVTYNKNGGTSVPSKITQSCGDSVILANNNEVSRASTTQSYAARFVVTADVNGTIVGSFSNRTTAPINLWGYNTTTYSLNSWNTKADGTGVTYTPGTEYIGTEKDSNLSLYAQWNVYPPSDFPTVSGNDYDTVQVDDLENYVFKGWYRKGNLIPTITPEATSFTFNNDYKYIAGTTPTTLYAKWIPTTYTVNYRNNSTPTNATIKNMPRPSEQVYQLNEQYQIPNEIPIYQYDEEDANLKDYNVIYNYQYNNIVYSETVGKRKDFLGWRNTADSSDNPTLYIAEWDNNGKNQKYYPALTATAGEILTFVSVWGEDIDASKLHIPTERNGYSFGGWFKDPNYIDLPDLDENGLLLPKEDRADIVLYAKWIPWIYRITYVGLSHDVQEWPYNSAQINITEEKPIKNPITNTYEVYIGDERNTYFEQFEVTKTFSFNNWKIVEDSDNAIYTPGQDIKSAFSGVDKARELWDETGIFKGYLLNLEPNWDITSIVPTLTLPSTDSIENCIGWKIYSLKENENGQIEQEEIAQIGKNITKYIPPDDCDIAIYPIIEADKWSVTYDANGGYFNKDITKTVIVDSNNPTKILDDLIIDKSNFNPTYVVTIHNEQNIIEPQQSVSISPIYSYSFAGWADKNGNLYGNESEINGNITLYAQWTEILEEGSRETIILSTSELEGYTFGGWYSDFRFITLISSDFSFEYKPIKNIDIYAKWSVEKYQIDYEINGGKIKTCPGSQIKSYNENIAISNIVPTYSDHIFMGWRGELKSPTNGYVDETTPLDNIKMGKINNNFVQIQNYYILSNSAIVAPLPGENWITDKPEPTENNPYLWAKIKITWPNSLEIEYTTPMYIGQQYHSEITEEYGLILKEDEHLEYILDWTTERPENWDDDFDLCERITVTWVTDLIQPKDIYNWNRSIVLIAQWRKIETLTEWLSLWETTPASENNPGNELVLKTEDGAVNSYLDPSQLLNALYRINNTTTYVYGEGYKLRLNLINPYGDINPETGKVQRLTRTIFVPAKTIRDSETDDIISYSGYYELPPEIKIVEASVYDGARVSVSYQAHMNLDYVDVNMPDFYEITEQVTGQINRLQVPNENITAMLKSKYYAKDSNETTTYEHSLDSWNIYSIQGPQNVEFEISTINNPTPIIYQLDSKGLFIKNTVTIIEGREIKEYLDLNEGINQCIFKGILNNNEYIITSDITNNLIINYKAVIAQRVYI